MNENPERREEVRRRAAAVLTPGETVLWAGAPQSRPLLMKIDRLLIPLGAIWLFLMAMMISQTLRAGFEPIMFVPIVMIVLGGGYYLAGRFLVRAVRLRRAGYAITDTRLLVFTGDKTTGIPFSAVVGTTLEKNRNGVGTITVRTAGGGQNMGNYGVALTLAMGIQTDKTGCVFLENLPDAERVFRLLQEHAGHT